MDGGVWVTDRMNLHCPVRQRDGARERALTRIATDPVLNVTAGGGSDVATFLVEER